MTTDSTAPPITTPKFDIDQFRSLIESGEATDPLVFLEALTSGQDPRTLSTLHTIIEEITEFDDTDLPDPDTWLRLVRLVRAKYRYQPVSLQESQNAANILMRHLHPTLKQVASHNTNITVDNTPTQPPKLSLEEIQLFKRVFDEEF